MSCAAAAQAYLGSSCLGGILNISIYNNGRVENREVIRFHTESEEVYWCVVFGELMRRRTFQMLHTNLLLVNHCVIKFCRSAQLHPHREIEEKLA